MNNTSDKIMKDIELFHNIDIQTLIINIKILSKLEVNDRPTFNEKYVSISKYYWYTPIVRYITQQSRQNILIGMTQLYNNVHLILNNSTVTIDHKTDLILELDNFVKNGLKNLSITYESDCIASSLLDFITTRLNKMIQIEVKQK